MSAITTHVLDTAAGHPAAGIAVRLEAWDGTWQVIGDGVTDDDGRVRDIGPDAVTAGYYRLIFNTGDYFERFGYDRWFFPYVEITFAVVADEHHHVPILLSPFAFSTYRGS